MHEHYFIRASNVIIRIFIKLWLCDCVQVNHDSAEHHVILPVTTSSQGDIDINIYTVRNCSNVIDRNEIYFCRLLFYWKLLYKYCYVIIPYQVDITSQWHTFLNSLITIVIPFNTSARLGVMKQVCTECGLLCNTSYHQLMLNWLMMS